MIQNNSSNFKQPICFNNVLFLKQKSQNQVRLMKKIYLLIIATSFSLATVIAQTTVSIPADKDNSIYSQSNTASNGAGEYLFAGVTNSGNKRRALVHFDLSTIPAGSIVTSATLTMMCNKAAANATGFSIHKLLADWGEGTSDAGSNEGGGGAAQPGDATWNQRLFPGTLWSTAGGDFNATASVNTGNVNPGSVTFASTAMTADIQGFINNASTNFGWIIISTNETSSQNARRFTSANSTEAGEVPTLSVTYQPNLPVTLTSFTVAQKSNTAIISWQTSTEINNKYFSVEHSTNGVEFSSVATINGAGNSNEVKNYNFIHTGLVSGSHYYRLAQFDIDGKFTFSRIVLLENKADLTLHVSPNPAISTIRFNQDVSQSEYTIYSLQGQRMMTGIIQNSQVNISSLQQGAYNIVVKTKGGDVLRSSFLKQ